LTGAPLETWFNNAWVVGIGGGILSGLVVAYLSQLIFNGKSKSEYIRNANSANIEILHAIRGGIAEDEIPDRFIVNDIIASSARKYSVRTEDVFGGVEIRQELNKEIMDSYLISPKLRTQYCSRIARLTQIAEPTGYTWNMDVLGTPASKDLEQLQASAREIQRLSRSYRAKSNERISIVLGLSAGILTVSSVIPFVLGFNMENIFGTIYESWSPLGAVSFSALLAVLAASTSAVLSILFGAYRESRSADGQDAIVTIRNIRRFQKGEPEPVTEPKTTERKDLSNALDISEKPDGNASH
jgi:hypothetical protein